MNTSIHPGFGAGCVFCFTKSCLSPPTAASNIDWDEGGLTLSPCCLLMKICHRYGISKDTTQLSIHLDQELDSQWTDPHIALIQASPLSWFEMFPLKACISPPKCEVEVLFGKQQWLNTLVLLHSPVESPFRWKGCEGHFLLKRML